MQVVVHIDVIVHYTAASDLENYCIDLRLETLALALFSQVSGLIILQKHSRMNLRTLNILIFVLLQHLAFCQKNNISPIGR